MEKSEILVKLSDIKKQISELGIKYVENQMPLALSDVSFVLRPFTGIDTAINSAIKTLSEEKKGLIPKQNTLKS